MKTAACEFILPPMIVLMVLAFMLIPADLPALMVIQASEVTFKILDAARYKSTGLTSLDIEILDSDHHIVSSGDRFNVELSLPQDSVIKIGQTLKADFKGSIDDMGSGRLSMIFVAETAVIVDENPSGVTIPWSFWEPVFVYLPALKVAFILFWWLVVLALVYRSNVRIVT